MGQDSCACKLHDGILIQSAYGAEGIKVGMNTKQTYFYHDKPVFGLDIGFDSVKVMQVAVGQKKQNTVLGYGVAAFDPAAIKDGVIADIESLAKSIQAMFANQITGDISTRRVVLAVPSTRTFTQSLSLPKMAKKDLRPAVLGEIEQYIPAQMDELYIDFDITRETPEGTELQVVAAPKVIVDSYLSLMQVLGLEIVAVETTISSSTRLFVQAEQSSVPTILMDFGSVSSDITIYDQAILTTGTVPGGGDSFTSLIADKLGVSKQEAHVIKTRYGLGVSKKQAEITDALKPMLDQLGKEVRRMIRYYEERSTDQRKISQIVTMGGGANMPGLSEYLTNSLRLAARMCDPWQNLSFDGLQPPSSSEKSMYVTATGLAMMQPKDAF
ncbi:MAG TPA: type IV pilus assembly protein PilM [Candidatus Limnocylindria bacterium]|nr:type IV pilus assembly protein PilM [Candidatus Limnocylindria bacterium]